MLRGVLNFFHHSFAKSAILVKLALLIRNQSNSIIAYHLISSPNSNENGEEFIVSKLAKQCIDIIDVGANKGEWTEYFLTQNQNVNALLIEPSGNAFTYLSNKFKYVNNVSIINKALGEKESEAIFFEEPDCGETSSLISSFSNAKSIKKNVSVTTIDLLFKNFGLNKIDYLKIDVEGYDFHVLKGAVKCLEEKKIKFIQFEYNSPWAKTGSTLFNAIIFLKNFNYNVYILRSEGLYNFNYDRYGEFFRYSNFFAVSKTNVHLIENLIKGAI